MLCWFLFFFFGLHVNSNCIIFMFRDCQMQIITPKFSKYLFTYYKAAVYYFWGFIEFSDLGSADYTQYHGLVWRMLLLWCGKKRIYHSKPGHLHFLKGSLKFYVSIVDAISVSFVAKYVVINRCYFCCLLLLNFFIYISGHGECDLFESLWTG